MASDPATNPDHELDVDPQDLEATDPDLPLARVVALLRAVAGEDGRAELRYWRLGHEHVVRVRRGAGSGA